MKKKSLISICVVSVFLLSGLALAGFEPMPFIGQLGAVENIIYSADDRIGKVMGIDPTPFEPSPALIGAVNRLGAIEKQLVAADDMVRSLADEVAGIDPEPFIPAFIRVKNAAQGIDDNIATFLGTSPDLIMPEFRTALEGVQGSAQDIVKTSQFINPGECDIDCSVFSYDVCEVNSCCAWDCEDAAIPEDCPFFGTCYNLPPEE